MSALRSTRTLSLRLGAALVATSIAAYFPSSCGPASSDDGVPAAAGSDRGGEPARIAGDQDADPRSDGDLRQAAFAEARARMIEDQIEARGVDDPRVLEAMSTVPRHEFVPAPYRSLAYEDRPLPLGPEQTISQPYIVALMTELLEADLDDRVLEVGTGSGYQAAVAARLVSEVYTIEIVPELARTAAERLERLGFGNVTVRAGDGYLGWPEHAPFDGILVTAGAEEVPRPLIEQLRTGGRMVIPVGPAGSAQTLRVLEKDEGGDVDVRDVLPVRFVPLRR